MSPNTLQTPSAMLSLHLIFLEFRSVGSAQLDSQKLLPASTLSSVKWARPPKVMRIMSGTK